jgi:predicted dehydrogenase
MLKTLIVGCGRSGGHLHLPSVLRARELDRAGLFASQPPCAIDPRVSSRGLEEVNLRRALEETGDLDPAHTVVHVCTPPAGRTTVIGTLAAYGFRRFIVEKPLASSMTELRWLERLVDRAALDVGVSVPWLSSVLTDRLKAELLEGSHGPLERIETVQDKSRFGRSLRNMDHASAFEVELPHAVALVSHLLGEPLEVTAAASSDLRAEGAALPHMGGARIEALHREGVRSTMRSNLQAPRRERLLRLVFAAGTVTGYYAVGGEDPYAQIVHEPPRESHHPCEVMFDDPFPRMMLEWYRYFAGLTPRPASDFELHASVVRTIARARARCGLEATPAEIVPAG